MRTVYRIVPAPFAADLSGSGARIYGGRWNKKAVPVIYTSESRSLAALEYLVHTSLVDMPAGIKLVSISFPARLTEEPINIHSLPPNWRMAPAPFDLAEIGTQWVTTGKTLLLRVPSVVIPQESNIIFNVAHPDMKYVRVSGTEDFEYDSRLYLPASGAK